MRFQVVFFFLSFFFISVCSAQPPGYVFGKQIEISSSLVSGSSDLDDFPFYLEITDVDLRTIANGGNMQSDQGFDVTFTLPDCITPLFFQIEDYNPLTGTLIAWIRIPVLSATSNTRIFMYYGNSSVTQNPSSTQTWTSNYEGVWHMDNDPSNTALLDYSGNGVDGTAFGGMTSSDLVDGKMGAAIDFDGSNDYFALAGKSYTNNGAVQQLTISAWVNTTFSNNTWSSNWSILDFDRSEYFNLFVHGNGRLGFATRGASSGINDSYGGVAGDLNDGNWHFVVGVYDGVNKMLYIDGSLVLTVNSPHSGTALGTGTNRFGFIGDGSEATSFNGNRNNIYYDGKYDEIRFLNTSLSANWINTEYNNQNGSSSFYTVTEQYLASDLCLLLPVEFGEIMAQLTEEQEVLVTWNTISEVNNDYFEVLRSRDLNYWEVIDIVTGVGNSTEELFYSSVDRFPLWITSYYRIKQVDFNGDFEYSPICSVDFSKEDEFSVFPNPTKGYVYVDGTKSTSISELAIYDELGRNALERIEIVNGTKSTSISELAIYDELGRNALERIEIVKLSENRHRLNLSNLRNGIYMIYWNDHVHRVLKQ